MTKIYEQSKDLHVKATVIYAHTDGKAYADAKHTIQFTTSDLKEAFVKGAMIEIIATGNLAFPCGYSENAETGVGTVTYIVANDAAAEIASLASTAE